MKKITLYGPAARNNGSYIDAGETVTIGTADDEIDADRAKIMVDLGTAVSLTAAKADERAGEKAQAEA